MPAQATASPQKPAPVLEGIGLERSFSGLRAVAGVDLALSPGELYGLVGPDGAGKTTLVRILAGLMAPTQGQARLEGRDPIAERRAVRGALGYMPQAYSLYGDLTIDENLRFFGRLFDLSKADYAARRKRLLDITRLDRFTDRRADALSGGMYKKLALACALLHRPRVLLLDEPTNGVDPVSRRELWDLLREFVDQGMAVLISTPYMDEAARCHRVGLMHQGRLLIEGEPDDMLAAFPHAAFELQDCSRDRAEGLLQAHPGVLGYSPAGSRIRVVLKGSAVEEIQAAIGELGGSLRSTRPDFEDVFLAHVAIEPEEHSGA